MVEDYEKRFPKAINTLDDDLEDSLSYYGFPNLDSCEIASTNMLERLNKEIRRRTRVFGIFPNQESYYSPGDNRDSDDAEQRLYTDAGGCEHIVSAVPFGMAAVLEATEAWSAESR